MDIWLNWVHTQLFTIQYQILGPRIWDAEEPSVLRCYLSPPCKAHLPGHIVLGVCWSNRWIPLEKGVGHGMRTGFCFWLFEGNHSLIFRGLRCRDLYLSAHKVTSSAYLWGGTVPILASCSPVLPWPGVSSGSQVGIMEITLNLLILGWTEKGLDPWLGPLSKPFHLHTLQGVGAVEWRELWLLSCLWPPAAQVLVPMPSTDV